MSVIESLFVMDLIVIPGVETDAGYNDTTFTHDENAGREVSGWVAQQNRSEDQAHRDSLVDQWICYLPKDDPITGFDQVKIVATGQTLEVQGPPWPALDADDGSESHVECTLRMVT